MCLSEEEGGGGEEGEGEEDEDEEEEKEEEEEWDQLGGVEVRCEDIQDISFAQFMPNPCHGQFHSRYQSHEARILAFLCLCRINLLEVCSSVITV